MATANWTPYGVALVLTANPGTVTRTSATTFTVKISASWKVYWSGASTNYGMTASAGGGSANLNSFGTYASSGSGSFTGTFSISGYGAQTKTITVTFTNTGANESANGYVEFNVSVPAWPSYTVSFNANGGSGAPSNQTKYKNVDLTLSTTKPTRTGYTFKNWNTKADGSGTTYASGGGYTGNAALTLYAQWTANTFAVKFDANGGTGAPGNQTKTYGVALTLSSTKPTRTNYNFLGWATSASATAAQYAAGGSYTDNSAVTLYAVWELAYWKPKVTEFAISRCTSSGTADEFGTYAKISFKWELCQLLGTNTTATIKVDWTGDGTADATFTGSGSSGTLSKVVGAGAIDVNTSYTFTVTVTDNRDSTAVSKTVASSAFPIDFLAGGKGVAFGKAASEEALDVYMQTIIRGSEDASASTASGQLIVGEPDGKHLAFDSNEIMAKTSGTASGNLYINTDGGTTIINDNAGNISLGNAEGEIDIHSHVYCDNSVTIYGNYNGTMKAAFQAQNSNGNTLVGYGGYSASSGDTNIYGNDVNIGSAAAGKTLYKPYYRKGDTISCWFQGAGYVTSSGTTVFFTVPLQKPIIGNPTITASSLSGFIIRQWNNYTHGTAASTYVKPTSYWINGSGLGVIVAAEFSSTSGVTNNACVGIQWEGKLTFS